MTPGASHISGPVVPDLPRSASRNLLLEALQSIPAVSGFSPGNLEVVYGMAYAHVSQEQYEKAAPIFTLLIQFSPTTQRYWRGLALCHQMLGRYDDAIALYELVDLLYGHSADVRLRIAECHIAQGRIDQALVALARLEVDGTKISPEINSRARALSALLSQET